VIEPAASGPLAASGAAARSGSAAATAPAAVGGAPNPDRSAAADPVSRGFEQLLVEQLAKEMLKTAGDAVGAYASLLPTALADAVQDAGGLGLDLQGPRS
jgi:hypothetical protein